MAAYRFNNRHTCRLQLIAQITNLLHTVLNVLKLHGFTQTNGHCFHVAPGQTAVGWHPFIYHHQLFSRREHLIIVHAQEPADIHQAVFFPAHGTPIGVAEHFMDDLFDALVLKAFFLLFDEIGVLYAAGCIVEDFNAMRLRQLPDGTHIRHRDRLTARKVHRHRQTDIGNIFGALFVNQFLQLFKIDIAFKGDIQTGIVRLITDDIHKGGAIFFLMITRGGEIHIPCNILPRFNRQLR